tara:strand:- start:3846 stop:4559 length:714 start_codon:yes stop_codon:yes gene_type:complete
MGLKIKNSKNIVTDGLILVLDASDPSSYSGSGTTWYDRSGNSTNGTLTNGVSFNSSDGGSMVFDGSNDAVAINPDFSSINEFSISLWAKNDVYGTTTTQALTGNYPSGGTYVRVNTQATKFYILTNINGIENSFFFSSGAIDYTSINQQGSENLWNNYVITFKNNDSAKCYINYNLIKTQTLSDSISGLNTSFKAVGNYANSYVWDGKIAETLFYSKSLSASEVERNYNATKSRFGL